MKEPLSVFLFIKYNRVLYESIYGFQCLFLILITSRLDINAQTSLFLAFSRKVKSQKY